MPLPAAHRFPRAPLFGALAAVSIALIAAAWGGLSPHRVAVDTSRPLAERVFRVADGAGGAVLLLDARDGSQIDSVTGQAGFLRGILRALARERRLHDYGPEAAFRLTAWSDGRLTLDDTATGERLDLEAFGSDNLAVFARLLPPQGKREGGSQ